jgi:DNA replication protein DnaC
MKNQAKSLKAVREAMQALHLEEMREQLERELETLPQSQDSHLLFLERLFQAQLAGRQQRSIERRLKAAQFPARKSLDDYDFVFQTGVRREFVMQLASLAFLRQRRSLLIAGMSGTGKSHIAISLGVLACAENYRVLYTNSSRMLATLHTAYATGQLFDAIKEYLRVDLLIIDEVGLDKAERQAAKVDDASLFYKVVAGRYDKQRSTIITSNIDWDDWGEHLGDAITTVAILDRLVHHSYTMTINGPSWRAKEHKQLNQDSAPGAETTA